MSKKEINDLQVLLEKLMNERASIFSECKTKEELYEADDYYKVIESCDNLLYYLDLKEDLYV